MSNLKFRAYKNGNFIQRDIFSLNNLISLSYYNNNFSMSLSEGWNA